MKNKKILILLSGLVLLVVVAIVIGIVTRKDYKQTINDDFKDVCITQLFSDVLLHLDGTMINTYAETSNYILKVKCTEEPSFDFQTCTEYAEIEKIFRADGNLQEGEEIVISRSIYHYFSKDSQVAGDNNVINTGFVNFMKPGKEYLVFITDKLVTELYDYDVYRIDGYSITPVFCYEDLENVIVPVNEYDNSGNPVEYNLVRDNEVFVENEKIEKLYYDFKHKIISDIDKEYE